MSNIIFTHENKWKSKKISRFIDQVCSVDACNADEKEFSCVRDLEEIY
jgi:hypothetical protein